MTTQMGLLYHVLIRTPPLPAKGGQRGSTLREIKKVAKRHKIPSMVFKRLGGSGGISGLVYAESRDETALELFERDVRCMSNHKQTFSTIVPVMRAPIREDRPIRQPGQRFVEVDGLTKFGTEMARRGLWDWYADFVKKGYFKD